jgi:hypothetical protein
VFCGVILNLTKRNRKQEVKKLKDGRFSVHIRVRQVTVPKLGFL